MVHLSITSSLLPSLKNNIKHYSLQKNTSIQSPITLVHYFPNSTIILAAF